MSARLICGKTWDDTGISNASHRAAAFMNSDGPPILCRSGIRISAALSCNSSKIPWLLYVYSPVATGILIAAATLASDCGLLPMTGSSYQPISNSSIRRARGLGRRNQLRCIDQQCDVGTQHLSDRPDTLHVFVRIRQPNVHFDRA